MSSLRSQVVRLAHAEPHLRSDLVRVLRGSGDPTQSKAFQVISKELGNRWFGDERITLITGKKALAPGPPGRANRLLPKVYIKLVDAFTRLGREFRRDPKVKVSVEAFAEVIGGWGEDWERHSSWTLEDFDDVVDSLRRLV